MILEFILKAPHQPAKFWLKTEPTDLLVFPHGVPCWQIVERKDPEQRLIPSHILVNDSLVERILVTDEDLIELENQKRKDEGLEETNRRTRTWRAEKWELRLFPRRTWVMHLTEITKIPGQIVG